MTSLRQRKFRVVLENGTVKEVWAKSKMEAFDVVADVIGYPRGEILEIIRTKPDPAPKAFALIAEFDGAA